MAVVTPPLGANGQVSTVTAYNSDSGQNSQFLPASPVIAGFSTPYGSETAPLVTSINPASLPAAAEAMVDITAAGVNFQQGLTNVGFGTSDVLVRRVFVLSSTHLQVDVSVSPGAALTSSDTSGIVTGFQLASSDRVVPDHRFRGPLDCQHPFLF